MRFLWPFLVTSILLQACSSDSTTSDSSTIKTGQFLDNTVQGLSYVTSGALSGTTNANGEFQYRKGESIEFFAGALSLGSFEGKSAISPFDLNVISEANRERSKNIITLLQSLDEDRNPNNGIDIRSALANDENNELANIDLNSPVYEFADNLEWQAIMGRLTGSSFFVSRGEALDHALLTGSTVFSTTELYLNVVLDASAPVLMSSGTKLISDGSTIAIAQTGNLNGYASQTVEVSNLDGSVSQLVTTENSSAEMLVEEFNVLSGISATASSSALILASSFTNVSGEMNIIFNGYNFQPTGSSVSSQLIDLVGKINERSLEGVNAIYNPLTGNLRILQSQGSDLFFGFEGGDSDSFQVQGNDSSATLVTLNSASTEAVVGGTLNILVDEGLTLSNASASNPIISTFDGQPFVNNAFSPSDSRTYNHTTSNTIYDSQGNPHVMALYFVKQAPALTGHNTWQLHILIDNQDVGDPLIGTTPSRASYGLVFNSDGSMNKTLSDEILISNWIPLGDDNLPNDALMPLNVADGGSLPITYPPTNSNFKIELNAHQLTSEFQVFDNYQNGLSSSNNTDDQTLLTGLFVDSPVQGLTYSSGSFSGTTNAAGEFSYRDKEFITFFVGDLQLGQFQGKPIITPFSSNRGTTDREKSKNIIRLLQSLDADSTPENGIDIRDTVANDVDKELAEMDLGLSVNAFAAEPDYQAILGRLTNSSTFVPLQNALVHAANEMLSAGLYPPDTRTSKVTLNAQLDASESVINTTFDPENEASYSHLVSTEIFDSLGSSHQLALYFVKTSDSETTWKVYILIDDQYVGDPIIGTAPSSSVFTLAFEDDSITKSILISNWVPLDINGNPNGAIGPLNFVDGGSLPVNLSFHGSNFELALNLTALESDFEIIELYQDGFSLNN